MRYPLSVIVVILLGTALLFSACSSPSQAKESPNKCESLNLGGVAVGAFDENKVKELLILEVDLLMIIPIGDINP